MQIKKIALLLILLLSLTVNVFAAGPLEEKTGSILVSMMHDGDPVKGGSLTIYHVASPVWQEDAYELVFTQQFADCQLSLDALNTQETVGQYAQYAIENRMVGMTQAIDSNGIVRFENLDLGLYLAIQQDAAEGYFEASPFLVMIPVERNGAWVYEVDASPKVSLREEPTEPTTPTTPQKPPANIPQTGQLKWPIPVLCIAGLTLFILGWALCFGNKKSKYET